MQFTHLPCYVLNMVIYMLMMTSSNGNIFRVPGPLCGRRWIPLTNPVTRSLDAFLSAPWINGWANNSDAGDLRRHRAHCDVTVMCHKILPMRHTPRIPWPDTRQGSYTWIKHFLSHWGRVTHMSEYQIIAHFDVPHFIHVRLSRYCDRYRYGMFSCKEDMIYWLLTLHVSSFHK